MIQLSRHQRLSISLLLAKQALPWIAMAAAMIAVVLFVMMPQQPPAHDVTRRALNEINEKSRALGVSDQLRVEEERKRAASHPDATRNDAELRNLTSEERGLRRKELEDNWKARSGIK